MRRFYLYSTLGCHLCEEAEAVLLPLLSQAQAVGLLVEIEVIDIAEEGLTDACGVRIPVLRCAQTERELDWPFDGEQARVFCRIDGV